MLVDREMTGGGIALVEKETMTIVNQELVSARTALAGYVAEIAMLESSGERNHGRGQYLLAALSRRLDELVQMDEAHSRTYQSDRSAGMASMAALVRELRALIDQCKNGLNQADLENIMCTFIKRKRSIENIPDRLVGTMRLAVNLRVRKEVSIDIARGFIREIENLTRQQRLITDEINAITQSEMCIIFVP